MPNERHANARPEWQLRGQLSGVLALVLLVCVPQRTIAQEITVPHLTEPPRLEDFTVLHESPVVRQMAAVRTLVQRTPVDGAPVSEPTVVYLGFDAQHLYAVFVCATVSGDVRAHRVNRDRLPDDNDSVALHLDTFRDRRRLYGFQVNAAGVQVDGVYTEGQGWDLSFDTVWTAEALIQPDRYVVLITIPFSSIRFPPGAEHEWGVFVYRGIPSKNEEAFWPAYSTRYQGRLAYAAALRGLRDLDARQRAQLVPYGSFRSERLDGSRDRLLDFAGGVDVKTVLRDSLVLDLTANPDFSQVESDEPITIVNRRFEVFFPEKRPFFIENASYFQTDIPVLFTRRIWDPRVGSRLTGKLGRYAVGALVSDDVSRTESGGHGLTSAFRVSRDVGEESQLGLIYVGRTDKSVENHVGGVDGRWRISPNWVASAQSLASRSSAPESPRRGGRALRAAIDGSGHRYAYRMTFLDISPEFQATSGFIPRTDIREVTQTAGATFRPVRSSVVAWGPNVAVSRIWAHNGDVLDTSVRVEGAADLRRSSRVALYRTMTQERLRPEDAPSLTIATRFDQRTTGVTLTSAPFSRLSFSAEFAAGTAINLSPAEGERPMLADSTTSNLTVSFRPTPALTIDTTYLRTTLTDRHSETTILSDQILRSRWNYQITRRLSARAIARYELLSTDSRHSSLVRRRDVNVDLLVTYLMHPGTALYIGYNADRQRVTRDRGEQLFVKASYLLRF